MLAPGQIVGSYEVVSEVGRGGFAVVYRVRHVALRSDYALKVLFPEHARVARLRRRFLDEGRVMAALKHPNIVLATDIVSAPGIAGIVMEFVDGPSLGELIAELSSPPRPDEVRAVFGPILDAVGHAHRAGVVHRDIKPDNVLMMRSRHGDLTPKVADFGIARVRGEIGGGPGPKESTVLGQRMGTVGYMSPEQVRSAGDVDARSDVFSLGATLFEFATLEQPFRVASDFDVMRSIVDSSFELPPWLCDGDPVLAAAIEKALQKDPDERFQSCEEFSDALRGTAPVPRRAAPRRAASDASLPPGAAPVPAHSPGRRVALVGLVSGVALGTFAVCGVGAWWGRAGLKGAGGDEPETVHPPASAFPASASGPALVVGTGRKYWPYFDLTGTPRGFDVEFGHELARRLGKQHASFRSGDSVRQRAARGEVDLSIGAISITPERERENLFSIPYHRTEFVAVAADGAGLRPAPDLSGLMCSVYRAHNLYRSILDKTACRLVEASSHDEAIEMVRDGRADVTVVDVANAGVVSGVVDTGVGLGGDRFGVALQLGNLVLKKAVDAAIRSLLSDGTLSELRDRFDL